MHINIPMMVGISLKFINHLWSSRKLFAVSLISEHQKNRVELIKKNNCLLKYKQNYNEQDGSFNFPLFYFNLCYFCFTITVLEVIIIFKIRIKNKKLKIKTIRIGKTENTTFFILFVTIL